MNKQQNKTTTKQQTKNYKLYTTSKQARYIHTYIQQQQKKKHTKTKHTDIQKKKQINKQTARKQNEVTKICTQQNNEAKSNNSKSK